MLTGSVIYVLARKARIYDVLGYVGIWYRLARIGKVLDTTGVPSQGYTWVHDFCATRIWAAQTQKTATLTISSIPHQVRFWQDDSCKLGEDFCKKPSAGPLIAHPAGLRACLQSGRLDTHPYALDFSCASAQSGLLVLGRNHGFVHVGVSSDTPQFAVDSIRQWWLTHGGKHYGQARELLILADAGGSNGYRLRCFKKQLQDRIADAFGLKVTVCHFPIGGQDARAENCCFGGFEVYG